MDEDQRKELRPQRISRRIKDIIVGGAAESSTSSEKDQMKDLCPQRISRRIKEIVVGRTVDRSSTSTQRIKRICIAKGASPRKFCPGALQGRVEGCGRRRFGRLSAEDQQQDQGPSSEEQRAINHIDGRG